MRLGALESEMRAFSESSQSDLKGWIGCVLDGGSPVNHTASVFLSLAQYQMAQLEAKPAPQPPKLETECFWIRTPESAL